MITQDVMKFLEAQSLGTRGTDLFGVSLPDDENGKYDNVLWVSGPAGVEADTHLPIQDFRVQVFVRSKDYDAGWTKIQAAYTALHRKYDTLVLAQGAVDVMRVHAIQTPAYIGQDVRGRYEFSVNFEFKIRQ